MKNSSCLQGTQVSKSPESVLSFPAMGPRNTETRVLPPPPRNRYSQPGSERRYCQHTHYKLGDGICDINNLQWQKWDGSLGQACGGLTVEWQERTFWSDRDVTHLNWGVSFRDVEICQSLSNSTLGRVDLKRDTNSRVPTVSHCHSLTCWQKSLKCSTWMHSQKWQNDLCSFPRQSILFNGNPSLCPNQ